MATQVSKFVNPLEKTAGRGDQLLSLAKRLRAVTGNSAFDVANRNSGAVLEKYLPDALAKGTGSFMPANIARAAKTGKKGLALNAPATFTPPIVPPAAAPQKALAAGPVPKQLSAGTNTTPKVEPKPAARPATKSAAKPAAKPSVKPKEEPKKASTDKGGTKYNQIKAYLEKHPKTTSGAASVGGAAAGGTAMAALGDKKDK